MIWPMMIRQTRPVFFALILTVSVSCSRGPGERPQEVSAASVPSIPGLPGMPGIVDPRNIYSETRAGMWSKAVEGFPARIYVPNSGSNTVDVIDPATYKVVGHFAVGRQPQHVVPSYDLKRLWVLNDLGDSVTEVNPANGRKGQTIPVKDPYNMYFTPDGKFAIVVAEREARLDFLDPRTMKLVESLKVPCRGVDHMDFTADGRYLIASCEFAAE